jgi:phosphatidate cytidylyltransferase
VVFSSENLKRFIVAVVVLPVLYLYITKLPPVFFLILLTVISIVGQMEFYLMYKTNRALAFLGVISGVMLLGSSLFQPSAISVSLQQTGLSIQPLVFIIAFILISSARLLLIKNPSSSLNDIAPIITGFIYIPNLLIAQWHLRLNGYEWIIFLYGCVWASDSLAYYIGKGIGKRKLYKEVSPNKTVEGAFGSLAGGILSALFLGKLMLNEISAPALILLGSIIALASITGDLVESMFKRDAGVKDSGSFIPGHGGILDKIDSVLFAGPVIYCCSIVLGLIH